MNPKEIKTYGDAADLVNQCDADDIQIYTYSLNRKHKLPIDNFLFFKELTGHDPEEYFPLVFWDDEDGECMID